MIRRTCAIKLASFSVVDCGEVEADGAVFFSFGQNFKPVDWSRRILLSLFRVHELVRDKKTNKSHFESC